MQADYRYPLFLRALHWSMALLIVAMILFGLAMGSVPRDLSRAWALRDWHGAFGVLVFALAALRLMLRLGSGEAPSPPLPEWERRAARIAHWLFYGFMLVVPALGYGAVAAVAGDKGVWFFGLHLPSFGAPNRALHNALEDLHGTAAFTFAGLLAVHVLAVLKHRFLDRQGSDVLPRMM